MTALVLATSNGTCVRPYIASCVHLPEYILHQIGKSSSSFSDILQLKSCRTCTECDDMCYILRDTHQGCNLVNLPFGMLYLHRYDNLTLPTPENWFLRLFGLAQAESKYMVSSAASLCSAQVSLIQWHSCEDVEFCILKVTTNEVRLCLSGGTPFHPPASCDSTQALPFEFPHRPPAWALPH